MELQLNLVVLKAMLGIASTDDTRYVINGVHVTGRKGERPLLVATDGRRMCIVRSEWVLPEDCAFTLPRDEIKGMKNGKTLNYICLTLDGLEVKAQVPGQSCTYTFHAIEGTYPNFKQVLPPHEKRTDLPWIGVMLPILDGFNAVLNAVYGGGQAKAVQLVFTETGGVLNAVYGGGQAKAVQLVFTETGGPIHIYSPECPDFCGLIMPTHIHGSRHNREKVELPQWVRAIMPPMPEPEKLVLEAPYREATP